MKQIQFQLVIFLGSLILFCYTAKNVLLIFLFLFVVVLMLDAIFVPDVRILVCDSSNAAAIRHPKSSELVVGAEKVDAETEFIIIASTGIWEVR